MTDNRRPKQTPDPSGIIRKLGVAFIILCFVALGYVSYVLWGLR